jgi:putative drug exporter of the RND superfamily
MLTGIANLVQLGFGVAIGIIIAAFGMAPLLVPSLAALQGRAFWWPTRTSPGPGDEPVGPPSPDPRPSPVRLRVRATPAHPWRVRGPRHRKAAKQPAESGDVEHTR